MLGDINFQLVMFYRALSPSLAYCLDGQLLPLPTLFILPCLFVVCCWSSWVVFFLDADSFLIFCSVQFEEFTHEMQDGWGLATDGKILFGTDGTSMLYQISPHNFRGALTRPIFHQASAIIVTFSFNRESFYTDRRQSSLQSWVNRLSDTGLMKFTT